MTTLHRIDAARLVEKYWFEQWSGELFPAAELAAVVTGFEPQTVIAVLDRWVTTHGDEW